MGRILSIGIFGRLAHDLSIRMMYPFLPEIAAGLRLPIDQLGTLVSLRNGIGIVGPILGALSDRIGHRRAMSIALVLLAIGLGFIGAADGVFAAAIGCIISGIGSALYIPTLIAYISERVPFARRGRVTGTIEMTWAISGMIGVPLVGLLIGSQGWRAPFIGLAVASLVCAASTLLLQETPTTQRAHATEPFKLASLRHSRSAIVFMLMWFLMFLAFENIQVGYGSWFEQHFGLSTAERGGTQILFGIFEVVASAGSSAFLDRIGKKRGVTGGLIVVLIGYGLLVTIGQVDLWLALAAISVAFLGFEFSVVSGIPIMSEQMPQARGTMLALGVTAGSVGRMAGDLTGSALTAGPGFIAAALISAIIAVFTLVLFWRGVQERPQANEQ